MVRPTNALEHTGFSVHAAAAAALDLRTPTLDRDHALWTHPTDYSACQDLADAARGATIGAILYRSVRDPAGGTNLALLQPDILLSTQPEERRTWRLLVGRTKVQAFPDIGDALEFTIAAWATDPRISALT